MFYVQTCNIFFLFKQRGIVKNMDPCFFIHTSLTACHSYCVPDEDECLTGHSCSCGALVGCTVTCSNTVGSYDCTCSTGFTLDATLLNCISEYDLYLPSTNTDAKTQTSGTANLLTFYHFHYILYALVASKSEPDQTISILVSAVFKAIKVYFLKNTRVHNFSKNCASNV